MLKVLPKNVQLLHITIKTDPNNPHKLIVDPEAKLEEKNLS